MQLGTVTFTWDPTRITPPEQYKPVASVKTFGGSAVFQWDARLQGAEVELYWDWMGETQFTNIRAVYLATDVVEFNPNAAGGGDTYYVIVKSLTSKYFEVANRDQPYREDVRMVLEIREQGDS